MLLTKLSAATAILQASVSNALFVRDLNGNWRSLSWEKRSNPGDVIKIQLTSNNDKSYSLPVRMGTPFQDIEMAVSLSQNHIAVASPDTPGQSGYYNPTKSQSFVQGNATTTVPDLTGKPVDCTFCGESCKIQDFAYNASVALTPASAQGNLYPDGCRGVLGYGVDPSPGVPADSTLLGVYLPPNITSAECGIELNRAEDKVGGGVFTMGGRDLSAFKGDFTSMVVPPATAMQRPSWTIPIDKVLGGVTSKLSSIVPAPGFASIDPYYPTISLPAYAVSALYSQIDQATVSASSPNRYTVPCDSKIQLAITFGGKTFNLDTRDAITREGNSCFGTVEIGDGSIFKIGSPFLRNVYTTFGATFSGKDATFTVAFADKAQRTSSSGNSTPSNAATHAVTSSNRLSILFFSLLVIIGISRIS